MSEGICLSGFVALRSLPKSSAEMISSLVFGDTYAVLEEEKDWLLIRNDFDHYEGWLSKSNHVTYNNDLVFETTKIQEKIETLDGRHIRLGAGVSVPQNNKFTYENIAFERLRTKQTRFATLGSIAKSYLGTPYLWGGRSIYGIDCSGFVQMVFKCFKVQLPRDSSEQSLMNSSKLHYDSLEEGCLVFFDKNDGKINHVGIFLGEGKVIHASGDVHIDQLSAEGIINNRGELTHYFAWGLIV